MPPKEGAPKPWNLRAAISIACNQLAISAMEPHARSQLESADVLAWQRVRDKSPRPVEFVVVWLHLKSKTGAPRWALVELFRYQGELAWRGEDRITDNDDAYSGHVRPYVAALTDAPTDHDETAAWMHKELGGTRCLYLDRQPDNHVVFEFLNRCAFFSPWIDGGKEVWDVIEERVVHRTAWIQLIGAEPSSEIVAGLGDYCEV
jgi:hypothetical protein